MSSSLSITKHKDEIIQSLDTHDILIITGHTGCGKSTKIPQYLHEYKMKQKNSDLQRIIVTQPRRIATVKMSKRVSEEANVNVAYTGNA